MAIVYQTLTGIAYTGRVVGISREELASDVAFRVMRWRDIEEFQAKSLTKKFAELVAKDCQSRDAKLYHCTHEELEGIAGKLGVDLNPDMTWGELHWQVENVHILADALEKYQEKITEATQEGTPEEQLKARVKEAYRRAVRKGDFTTGQTILYFLRKGKITFACNPVWCTPASMKERKILADCGCRVVYSRFDSTDTVYLDPSERYEEIKQEEKKMAKMMSIDELYAALEGKTERTEIEEILKCATVAALKEYLKNEGLNYGGYSSLKKAELVQEATDLTMEAIEVEEARAEIVHEIVMEESMKEGIEKYHAGEMTADALDSLLYNVPISALKEYAQKKWIMLPPDDDRKEILKAVWEGILCDHFGNLEEEEENEIPYNI